MPAQPLLDPRGARRRDRRGDRPAASTHGSGCSSGRGRLRPRLAQSGPGDGERVDRVRLATLPARCAARAPSASAAPAPAARRQRSAPARAPRVSCRQSSIAHSRSPPSAAAQPQARRCRPQQSARRASARPRRPQPPSTTACVRPLRSRSLRSPPPTMGATGERTDLNRGSSQAPIRSRSTVSGRRRRHNAGKSALRATCGNGVSRRRPESLARTGRHHPTENDIEFGNDA